MNIQRIQHAPDNIHQFVDEIIPAYRHLYGDAAATTYRDTAPTQLVATIAHPSIRAYAALVGNQAMALLFVRSTDTRHILSFLHVLQPHDDSVIAPSLINCMLSEIPNDDDRLVISEYVSFCPLDLDATYQSLGFMRVDRQFMRHACTEAPATTADDFQVRTAAVGDRETLAQVLATTYTVHPEHILYEEVGSTPKARQFLQKCDAGMFGPCPHDYTLGAWQDGNCVGLIVGTEIVAEMGFVLHMAVLPSHQGCGIGKHLLNALTGRFWDHGLNYAALNVTKDNPAVHLYKNAGFETVQPFTVYYREKPAR